MQVKVKLGDPEKEYTLDNHVKAEFECEAQFGKGCSVLLNEGTTSSILKALFGLCVNPDKGTFDEFIAPITYLDIPEIGKVVTDLFKKGQPTDAQQEELKNS